ncbi:MAG: SUMF1/EgtB/PvdO family nonheme iron enzyme [Planctomycetes bacterium]|nr:SUMF1/EgtB/PvdO family nonheme iron enzyme [Planctomycetota bacterium]
MRKANHGIRLALFMALLASCASEQTAQGPLAQAEPAPTRPNPVPFHIAVPGTTVKLEFVPIPRDERTPGAREYYLAATETTWDMYDAFVFAMDRAEGQVDPPDAWARPSKPYILMDRGFGHAGYPAISVSYKGASEFCKWLAHKTGKRLRLPSEAEWEHACRAGTSAITNLNDIAWFKENSAVDMRETTHPIATKSPDALGLYDMLGNAAEWTTSAAGTGVARGGSFKEPADAVTAIARRPDDKSLNRTDPQIPRSVWWLADGGFIGFRVLCEIEPDR